jgi:hypothetical protein
MLGFAAAQTAGAWQVPQPSARTPSTVKLANTPDVTVVHVHNQQNAQHDMHIVGAQTPPIATTQHNSNMEDAPQTTARCTLKPNPVTTAH